MNEEFTLKLNIDQIGKRQRCFFILKILIITVCILLGCLFLSPKTTIDPSGPIQMCDDINYDTNKGYCTYLLSDKNLPVQYVFRLSNVSSLNKYILTDLRPILKTTSSEEQGKFFNFVKL